MPPGSSDMLQYFATDFLQQCLSTPDVNTTISPTPLLREWAKLKLAGGSWKDALVATVNVSVFYPGTPRGLDTRLVWSLQYRDSLFIGFFATISKHLTR